MIREAELSDIPEIVEMAKAFHSETDWRDYAAFDEASLAETAQGIILADTGRFLVFDRDGLQGFICGFVNPLYFNKSVSIAHELLWWVRPGARNGIGAQLLAEFHRGADLAVQTVSEITPRKNAVKRLLGMKNWRAVESAFIKRLN